MTAALGVFALLLCGPAAGVAVGDQPQAKARLAFVNGDRIFAIDADGGNRLALTSRAASLGEYDEEYDSAPRVSPDGRSFLFLREVDYDAENFRGEYTKLMVGSMDGTGTHLVTNSKRLESKKERFAPQVYLDSAGWSRDGSRILFTQTDESFRSNRNGGIAGSRSFSRIRSIRPDGSALKTVLKSHLRFRQGKGYDGPGTFSDIDVSAGNRLLVTKVLRPGARSDIHVVNLKHGSSKRLVRSASHGRWSPDGKSILFLSDRDRTGEQCYEGGCEFQQKIYTANADGTGQHLVLGKKQAGTVVGADWSPDGTRIAFGSDRNMPGFLGMTFEVYSVGADGTCLAWLTNGSPQSADPDWSPATGFDSSPAACGEGNLDVVVDPLPPEHPIIDDKPANWPLLWLGPVYRGAVVLSPFWEADTLTYLDCASFKRGDCRTVYTEVESSDVCDRTVSDFLEPGRYRGMFERRGALLMRPVFNWDGYREAVLITGGQTVAVTVEDFSEELTPLSEYLDVVDSLRPVGHDELAGANLEPPVFNRDEVRKAAGITASFERLGSVSKVARERRFDDIRTVRAYLKFHQDIVRFGPVETVRCEF